MQTHPRKMRVCIPFTISQAGEAASRGLLREFDLEFEGHRQQCFHSRWEKMRLVGKREGCMGSERLLLLNVDQECMISPPDRDPQNRVSQGYFKLNFCQEEELEERDSNKRVGRRKSLVIIEKLKIAIWRRYCLH